MNTFLALTVALVIFVFGAVLGIALANEQNYAAETDRQNASGQSAAASSGANTTAESSTYRPHPYTPADKFAVAAKPENWPQLLGSGLTFVTLVVLLFTLREVAAQARATERAVNVANLTRIKGQSAYVSFETNWIAPDVADNLHGAPIHVFARSKIAIKVRNYGQTPAYRVRCDARVGRDGLAWPREEFTNTWALLAPGEKKFIGFGEFWQIFGRPPHPVLMDLFAGRQAMLVRVHLFADDIFGRTHETFALMERFGTTGAFSYREFRHHVTKPRGEEQD